MQKNLPLTSFLFGTAFFTLTVTAQQPDRFAFAITDIQPTTGGNWSFLRKLNLQTGEYSPVLLSGNDASLLAYDAVTKKQFTTPLNDAMFGQTVNAAFATGVAAMAYDRKNNRIYYTPMFIDQLRYLDLKTMKVFFATDQPFTGKAQKSPDQGNIVTRMVIASDGNGYAMTNDGRQLIRFTTGKKLQVTDLGTVVDDQSNKDASIHSSCSSYGGDMIADDNGNIFVFSARNHVFKINTENKVATHLGIISGLPNGFTVNGAAVNDNNQIIVSSASNVSSYFTVDHKTWTATPFVINGIVWQSSDLANSNLLVTNERPSADESDVINVKAAALSDSKVSLYPNPVTNNNFNLQFNQLESGNYTIIVTDVTGVQVVRQAIVVNGDSQNSFVRFSPGAAKGVYLVKIINSANKSVYSSKIVVQ